MNIVQTLLEAGEEGALFVIHADHAKKRFRALYRANDWDDNPDLRGPRIHTFQRSLFDQNSGKALFENLDNLLPEDVELLVHAPAEGIVTHSDGGFHLPCHITARVAEEVMA